MSKPLPPGSFTCTGAGLSNRVVAHLTGVIGPPCPNRAITFERETMRLARSKGQLGNNAAIKNSATPVQVKAKVGDLPGMKAIAASSAHGTVWSWGWNNNGRAAWRWFDQLAIVHTGGGVGLGRQWLEAAGKPIDTRRRKRNCRTSEVVPKDHRSGFSPRLGNQRRRGDRSTAAAVKGGKKLGSLIKKVKAIAAGGTGTILQPSGGHSLALVAQGEVFGWGWNVKGQLGLDNQFADQLVPDSAVQTLTEPDPNLGGQQSYVPLPMVAAIAAGGLHSLAIGPDSPPK